VGDKRAEAPLHNEAQGRALHNNRTLRDALAALAFVVVAEDLLNLLLSQLLHVEQDCRNLVWLAPGTAQFKESYRYVADEAANRIGWLTKFAFNYLLQLQYVVSSTSNGGNNNCLLYLELSASFFGNRKLSGNNRVLRAPVWLLPLTWRSACPLSRCGQRKH
jgi:hypothetical protein